MRSGTGPPAAWSTPPVRAPDRARMAPWTCGPEQRRRHRSARRTRGAAGARVRVRPEHVAPGGARAGRATSGWSCSTTSGPGRSDLSAWSEQRYAIAGRLRRGRAGDLPRSSTCGEVVFVGHSVSAMIGVLAATGEPERFAALVLLDPSPRYIDDGGYRGGFSAADIDELLESLDSNYLGWSAAMAPVIMGNPDRPELGEELTNSFCRTDPRDRPGLRPGHVPVRQPRRPGRGDRADAGPRSARRTPSRRREVGAYVHAADPRQPPGHPRRHRALPAAERPGGDRRRRSPSFVGGLPVMCRHRRP